VSFVALKRLQQKFIFSFRPMKRYSEHPFWEADCPVATRKSRLNDMYTDFDTWRRFTDVESCGEFEEVKIQST
jgi:hypothetical protein